jgi:glycosyltransferase involved in cell wall biosynthesis
MTPRQGRLVQSILEAEPRRTLTIGVMLRHFEQKDGGVRVYTRRILPHLFTMGVEHKWVLIYQNPALVGTFEDYPNVHEIACTVPGTVLWDQVGIPRVAREQKLDVIFNPKFTVPFFTRAKTCFVMHGSEWFVIPEHFLWFDRLYFKRAVPAYLRSADSVIAVSHAVKRDAVRYTGVPAGKIAAIHNGFDPQGFHPVRDPARLAEVRARYRLPERFVVWVGQMESRKNLGRLFEAMARVKHRIPHSLVLAGAQRHQFPMAAGVAEDLQIIEQRGIEDRVHFAGWINHDDLPAVYSLADGFVFPSLYEGFGIPLLEAMACGCPILTATTCAPPEVVNGAARLVDPLDIDAIAEGIVELVQDEVLRARLISRGLRRAGDFSWTKCASEVLTLLERTAQGKRAVT